MRISDWSSDVCSSDLRHLEIVRPAVRRAEAERHVIVARALHVRDRRIVIGGETELFILGAGHGLMLFVWGVSGGIVQPFQMSMQGRPGKRPDRKSVV